MSLPRAADDFPVIRARMENLGASALSYQPREGAARRPTRGLVIAPRVKDRAERRSRESPARRASATARRAPIVRTAT